MMAYLRILLAELQPVRLYLEGSPSSALLERGGLGLSAGSHYGYYR